MIDLEDIMEKLFDKKVVVLDGAMGTMLQNSGLKIGEKPEMLNITNPQIVYNIHKAYLESGADIIYTNTFGANRVKLKDYPYQEVIEKGIEIAKQAVSDFGYGKIALDMGSIGELLEPIGSLSFDTAYDIYKEIVLIAKDNVDLFVIETMSDLYELKAAVLAVKENCSLPVITTMSFDQSMRTFAGCPIEAMIATMEGLGVEALGVNCSLGPKQLNDIVNVLVKKCSLPIVLKPNAGLPFIRNGVTKYDVSAEEFANIMAEYVKQGVSIVGGCCGTTDEYIAKLAEKVKNLTPVTRNVEAVSCLASGTRYLEIDSPKIIGERINPTGKKLMREAIANKDIGYFENQAVEQFQAGADILDINMGVPNINEAEMMKIAVKSVQGVVDLPVQIDSSDSLAVEMGARYANGKVIINSVNGDDEVLDRILPIAKKYGAMVLGLTIDKDGVPKSVEKRLQIAEKIVNYASKIGIKKENLIIDCLTLTVGAEQEQAMKTLQALKLVKDKLGVKTVLGVSNISFGLPNRQIVNSHFLTMALSYGLDLAIINPNISEMMQSFRVYNLISGNDKNGEKYIQNFACPTESKAATMNTDSLKDCIIKSLKSNAVQIVKSLLENKNGLDIIDCEIIPALDYVGEMYEKGKLFLPQLISSAETAKNVCDIIKMSLGNSKEISQTKIVLATVEGDVHDIGKNIVKTVLQNYGYQIIDLGKDVQVEKVVQEVKKCKPEVLGLSALMTTTVKNMERTIKAVREVDNNITIFVGGAVLNEGVAKDIGADYYSKDPRQMINILKNLNL